MNTLVRVWRERPLETGIGIAFFVLIHLVLVGPAFQRYWWIKDSANAGQFGDFVGGYFGTLFGLISVLLLISTLRHQRESSERESFENRYFELLKMHRDNVAEMQIGNSSSRKIFVLLLDEFRGILEIVKETAIRNAQNISNEQLLVISYNILFYGVGANSSRMLRASLTPYDNDFVTSLDERLGSLETKAQISSQRRLAYQPFDGHQSRLGHYYRHLYQTVRYVDTCTLNIGKYEYVKTIRAQLSTHEQALLLLNSRAQVGRKWWDERLLERYRLVRNIPREFFDSATEINLVALFGHDYFEWQEAVVDS